MADLLAELFEKAAVSGRSSSGTSPWTTPLRTVAGLHGSAPLRELLAERGSTGWIQVERSEIDGAVAKGLWLHETVATSKAAKEERQVQHLRITSPEHLTDSVIDVFVGDPAVSQLAVMRGSSIEPLGDIVEADVAREATNVIVDRLGALGIPECGTIHIEPVTAWLSRAGFTAERRTPGAGADSVVWADVTQRAYEESELNWTYLAFMTLATLLAAIAIVVDSQVLVIGAMVLGPEFVAIAALGLALVRRRGRLFWAAARTLVIGFGVSIALTTVAALAARALGWVAVEDVTGKRPSTEFIYSADKWSFIVALIAAAAGVLSLTSAKVGGLSGVFISVTTVPAAGNIALGIAVGAGGEVAGSAIQLALNISGMILAGWMTLALQQVIWNRVARHRVRMLARRDE